MISPSLYIEEPKSRRSKCQRKINERLSYCATCSFHCGCRFRKVCTNGQRGTIDKPFDFAYRSAFSTIAFPTPLPPSSGGTSVWMSAIMGSSRSYSIKAVCPSTWSSKRCRSLLSLSDSSSYFICDEVRTSQRFMQERSFRLLTFKL